MVTILVEGFGFLDNALMIVFGASIEASVGLTFNLTVMAAAALGNTFSDMGGVFMGNYVEHLAEKLNLPKANLSDKQKTYRSAKFADAFGSCFGNSHFIQSSEKHLLFRSSGRLYFGNDSIDLLHPKYGYDTREKCIQEAR